MRWREISAASSVIAFSKWRVTTGVLCRVTDVAAMWPLLAARAQGREQKPISAVQRRRRTGR